MSSGTRYMMRLRSLAAGANSDWLYGPHMLTYSGITGVEVLSDSTTDMYDIQCDDNTAAVLKLTWPSNASAGTYTIYRVSGGVSSIETVVDSSVNYKFITGLSPGTAYTFRVRANTSDSISDKNVNDVTQTTSSTYMPCVVVGQNSFNSANSPQFVKGINSVMGLVATPDNSKFIVSETNRDRVLIYEGADPTVNGVPSIILGGYDKNATGAGGVTQRSFNRNRGVDTDGTRLVVADTNNNRVLIWNTFPTQDYQLADLVLGQANFTTSTANAGGNCPTMSAPQKAIIVGNRLFVSDNANNRVLVWNTWPTTPGQVADFILGQPNPTSSTANNGGISAATMSGPQGIISDGTRLFVADYTNNRVLVWSDITTLSTGQAASYVLGQPNSTSNTANNGGLSLSTMQTPIDLAISGTKLLLNEYTNHRIKVWNTIPTSNVAGDDVLGQASGTVGSANRGSSTAINTINSPYRITANANAIWISDLSNNRLVGYSPTISSNGPNAIGLWGQPTYTTAMASGAYADANALSPMDAQIVGSKFMALDFPNSRILVWNSVPTSHNQAADYVIGQPDRYSTGAATTQSRFSSARSFSSDGTRLAVADATNNRVMYWNSLPTSDGANASIVLGQTLFTTSTANLGGLSASTLNNVMSVVFAKLETLCH